MAITAEQIVTKQSVDWLARRALSGEVEKLLLPCMAAWRIYVCASYIHNPESARKILWNQLKKNLF